MRKKKRTLLLFQAMKVSDVILLAFVTIQINLAYFQRSAEKRKVHLRDG